MIAAFNGLDLLGIVLVVVFALYGSWRLDAYEDDRELEWRYEESVRRASESLDEAERPFDQEVA